MNRSLAATPTLFVSLLVGCGDTPMPPAEPSVAATPAAVTPAPAASATASTSAASPPSPIDGMLPPDPIATPLAVRVDHGGPGCKPIALADLAKKLPAGSPVAVFEAALGDKGCLAFANDQGLEVAGALLAGRARVEADRTKAPIALAAPWTTFRVPGGGLTLHGVAAARVLVIVATSGEPIESREPGKPWAKRDVDPTLVKLDTSPDLAWAQGAYHARIAFPNAPVLPDDMPHPDHDAPALAIDSLLFSPDASVAEHLHDKQWECLVVLEGDGELVQEPGGAAPDLHQTLAPGAILCVPPNRLHRYAHGKTRLLALQIYTPPGPEQRFRKLANP